MQNKKSILIVDDDKFLSGALQGLLEEHGHAVSCSYRGLDAIKLSKERTFDMILVDYHMPEMNGDLICSLLRRDHPNSYIVGFSSECKDRAFIDAGADKFIHKADLAQNISLLNQLMQTTPS